MLLYCSNCEKPVHDPDFGPVTDGILFSCTECDGPIAWCSYEELDNEESVIILTPDQRRYLQHLVHKQMDKLENALEQLCDIDEKLAE